MAPENATRNEELVAALSSARDMIVTLQDEIKKLSTPPLSYAVVAQVREDGSADVVANGRRMRVNVSPGIKPSELEPGRYVILNETLNVVTIGGYETGGIVATVINVLGGGRALVQTEHDMERVVALSAALEGVQLRPGDSLLLDPVPGYAHEVIPKSEVEQLALEEVPDIGYGDIGGLSRQIEDIRDAVELPYLHAALFREYHLRPPKGVLLYGAPGCGKTLIAKAVARSLADKVAEGGKGTAYFLNIKGPELLNKYVGETERHIRLVFQRAKEKASEGMPVIIFFDEMESVFRTRGSGISQDTENTIVPQLLAEIDGVESLENVIVIGASNREDMIDPAILRPGRLDVKIKIERPDAGAAADIFGKYLTDDLPYAATNPGLVVLIGEVVKHMYAETDANRFLEITYTDGEREVLYFKDFASGAMIANIVDRAKKNAIKDLLAGHGKGISFAHLRDAVAAEYKENEDLPNTTSPDDWARISGRKGEKIRHVRTLVAEGENARSIEPVTAMGQYL